MLQTRRDAILDSRVAPFTHKQVVLVQDLWIYCLGASFASLVLPAGSQMLHVLTQLFLL